MGTFDLFLPAPLSLLVSSSVCRDVLGPGSFIQKLCRYMCASLYISEIHILYLMTTVHAGGGWAC